MPTRSTSWRYCDPLYRDPLCYDPFNYDPTPQMIVRDHNGRQLHVGDTVRVMPEQIYDIDSVVERYPRFAQAGFQGRIEEFDRWGTEYHLKLDTLDRGYVGANVVVYVVPTHEISDSAMLSLLGQT